MLFPTKMADSDSLEDVSNARVITSANLKTACASSDFVQAKVNFLMHGRAHLGRVNKQSFSLLDK